ncbi:hypothetical protein OBBRIDRAFT_791448 [Obba rivulosa]|uniref:Transmembrane protein n=1 Tax=Obba rivulosa TaxID=1052685 RepID=A0A8E2AXP3_9APHY|nr:hypothetical protein OBBRIDRAFT_791448 [Obba rivulosa]
MLVRLCFLASTLVLIRLVACQPSTNATCMSEFSWLDNSLGQSSCLVAAYAMGACGSGDTWNVPALNQIEGRYTGPTGSQANACTCNSVSYSLMSACNFCQNFQTLVWMTWTKNCSASDAANGAYPHAIPSGVAFPAWAYPTIITEWDYMQVELIASEKEPDSTAGGPTSSASISSTGSSTPTGGSSTPTGGSSVLAGGSSTSAGGPSASAGSSSATRGTSPQLTSGVTGDGQSFTLSFTDGASTVTVPSQTGRPTNSGSSSKKHSNSAAIIGGAVGGGIGLILVASLALMLYRWRRKARSQSTTPSFPVTGPSSSLPLPSLSPALEEKVGPASYMASLATESASPLLTPTPSAPLAPLRYYDPEDPSTFPDAVPHLPHNSFVSSASDRRASLLPQMPQAGKRPIPEV